MQVRSNGASRSVLVHLLRVPRNAARSAPHEQGLKFFALANAELVDVHNIFHS